MGSKAQLVGRDNDLGGGVDNLARHVSLSTSGSRASFPIGERFGDLEELGAGGHRRYQHRDGDAGVDEGSMCEVAVAEVEKVAEGATMLAVAAGRSMSVVAVNVRII